MVASRSKLTKRKLFAALDFFVRSISIRERGSLKTGVFFFITGKVKNALVHYPKRVMGVVISRYGFCSEMLRPSGREKASSDGALAFRKRVMVRKSELRQWIRQHQAANRAPHLSEIHPPLSDESNSESISRK